MTAHRSFRIRKIDIRISSVGVLSFLSCFNNQYLTASIPLYRFGIIALRVMLFIGLVLIVFAKKKSISIITKAYILMYAAICFSTFIKDGKLVLAIIEYMTSLNLLLSLELYSSNERCLSQLLRTWEICLLIVVMIDFITELLFPMGLYLDRIGYKNWFLGYKSARMIYIFPLIFISIVLKKYTKNRNNIATYLMVFMLALETYLSNATAASVSLLLLLGLLIIVDNLYRKPFVYTKKMLGFLLNHRVVIGIYVIITILIVFLNNSYVMGKIAEALGKDISFSSRTMIWIACIQQILSSPVFGRGYLESVDYEMFTFFGGTNAHNAVLTILMTGGSVGLVIYYYIYAQSMKKRGKLSQMEMKLSSVIYTTWIMGITSSIFVFSAFSIFMYWIMFYYLSVVD